jgi:hypothetical protein
MAHAIPVSVSGYPGVPVPVDLVAEVFWVTVNGDLVDQLDRFPVQDGLAVYNGPPLGAPHLRWAITIHDYSTASAVFRSGPLRRLPGPPSDTRPTGRISIFVCGQPNVQLPEIGPALIASRLESLPPPLQFVGVELGSDDEGHYTVTVRGRLEIADRVLPFVYGRTLRLKGGLDPGRVERVVEARPEGTAKIRGANVRPYATQLDEAITTSVEALFWEAGLYAAQLTMSLAGSPFDPTTISAGAIRLIRYPPQPNDPTLATEAHVALTAGAVTGAVIGPSPADAT